MSTLPLASTGITIDPTGAYGPSYSDILGTFIAKSQGIFGSDIYLPPDSQDYMLLALVALANRDTNNGGIVAYNCLSPQKAVGAALSSNVKLNGIARLIPTNSSVVITIYGQVGTQIFGGIVQDQQNNLWNIDEVVEIPLAGFISVTATAQQQGNIQADPNTVNKIYTQVRGWQSVSNPLAAVAGAPVELDGALRQRQTLSVAISAKTPIGTIVSSVGNVSGVTRFKGYENDTNATDANGIVAHTIAMVAAGGDALDICTVIERTKSPGTGTQGNVSRVVIDPEGLPITIRYYEMGQTPVYLSVSLHPLDGFVSTTLNVIAKAIVDYINTLSIGDTVYKNRCIGVASLINSPLSTTFAVEELLLGPDPGSLGPDDMSILFTDAATCDLGNIQFALI